MWQPKDMEDWEANISTKLKNLIDILLHHLAKDNAPMLKRASSDSNDLDEDPAWDLVEGDGYVINLKDPDRIIIYVAFPSNNHVITAVSSVVLIYNYLLTLILQVLRLHGIRYIEINGTKRASVRSKDLDAFRNFERDGPRVCLLSNVGTVGHNLPQANILVALVSF